MHERIIKGLTEGERAGCHNAINWSDLNCTSARVVADDHGDVVLEILIEEAEPDAAELHELISGKLHEAGWHHIVVLTEW